MHAFLPDLKYSSPPLWCSIIIGCLGLHSKAFYVLSMHWLLHVLAIHSVVNAMPILGCPRWLLLSLFIKLDSTPKYGVAWFIMNKLNKSFISWILLRTVLWLAVCLLQNPIKRLFSVDLILDCQLATDLPQLKQYSSSICYHQPS
jgi:hypothetical protein